MFLAGADGQTPELRAPSIKGAMRFWWRALQREASPEVLKKKEDYIFGGIGIGGKEEKAKRSKVILMVVPGKGCKPGDETTNSLPYHRVKTRHNGAESTINVLDYLAYGVTGRGATERPYFENGAEFQLKLRFHPTLSSDAKNEVLSALILLGKYGGLGSKNRNGFGSFIVSYQGEEVWCAKLFNESVLGLAKGSRINYTAFSKDAELYETGFHTSWDSALAEVGVAYRGEYPPIRSTKGSKGRLGLDTLHEGHQRKYIAMPLQRVEFSSIDVNERRPKSLFLGVSQSGTQYKGHILYLPDTYLHNGVSQQAKHDKAYKELMKNFSSLTEVSF